jgi:hypothetical protein
LYNSSSSSAAQKLRAQISLFNTMYNSKVSSAPLAQRVAAYHSYQS